MNEIERVSEWKYIIINSIKGIQHNVNGHGIGLCLQDLAHDLAGVVTNVLDPVEEVLEIILLHTLFHHRQRTLLQNRLHQLGSL